MSFWSCLASFVLFPASPLTSSRNGWRIARVFPTLSTTLERAFACSDASALVSVRNALTAASFKAATPLKMAP
eukprot:CAMPEP_0179337300 /NCGR_PEP_ID=MMETSP0797-20121207/67542_1 /TAXON_ID=47934 /ORGANISM="Dinophysis acuminata, Strain DAEP01" /LENGTH=72 /DNA_ID=CAMNT_0021050923 /DNA_START=121 /DNA_END=339 /DNA_ORIENTATION=+